MVDLNKLRQTKEYQGWRLNNQDQEAARQMAEIDKQENLDKIIAKQIEEEMNPTKSFNLKRGYREQMVEIDKQEQMNPSKYTENDLEKAKEIIINKITKHFDDVMFEMVNDEMSESYLFQSSNYLTEAGYDVFEDEWFEFYHEHHGDIMHQVMQNITN